MGKNFRIIIPETKDHVDSYYTLRYEVLRKPWGQEAHTTKDEWEEQSLHVLMLDDDGNAIATGRLQFNSDDEGQIRSMAVAEKFRSKGLGTQILKFIEEKAKEKKLDRIILDARDNAVHFYEKNGYEVLGDSYVLFGIIPHFRMTKKLL